VNLSDEEAKEEQEQIPVPTTTNNLNIERLRELNRNES